MKALFFTTLLVTLVLAGGARAATRAIVFQSDYTTGSVSTVDLSPRTAHCDVASVNSDASMRWWNGLLWVVNRYGGDNVQAVDPATGNTVRQFSVGAGSNPHDIAFVSATKAYVTRFDATDLWVVNPATGAHTGTIPLAALADADGIPEMDRLEMVGPLLFVSLERVNRNAGYAPTDSSLIAVVDTRADTLVDCDRAHAGTQGILLQSKNPFTAFQFDHATSTLLIGCVGAFGVLDGGIERVDPVNLASDGVVASEAALGGDVNAIAWGDAGKSWAVVADLAGNTKLVSFSATSGALTGTLWNPGGYVLSDVALDGAGGLWVCENSFTSPRVRVFSAATGLATGSDVACTLPPVSVTFDAASAQVSGVDAPAAAGTAFATAAPNPARHTAGFAFTLGAGARVRADVFDAAGRRVRQLADGDWPAGRAVLAWDLADDSGARVAPGLYFARLSGGGAMVTRAVVVIR